MRRFTVVIAGPDFYDEDPRVPATAEAAQGPRRPSPYAGGLFRIQVTTPQSYPRKEGGCPGLEFATSIAHPFVDKGKMCNDLLLEAWTQAWTPSCDSIVELSGQKVFPHPEAVE